MNYQLYSFPIIIEDDQKERPYNLYLFLFFIGFSSWLSTDFSPDRFGTRSEKQAIFITLWLIFTLIVLIMYIILIKSIRFIDKRLDSNQKYLEIKGRLVKFFSKLNVSLTMFFLTFSFSMIAGAIIGISINVFDWELFPIVDQVLKNSVLMDLFFITLILNISNNLIDSLWFSIGDLVEAITETKKLIEELDENPPNWFYDKKWMILRSRFDLMMYLLYEFIESRFGHDSFEFITGDELLFTLATESKQVLLGIKNSIDDLYTALLSMNIKKVMKEISDIEKAISRTKKKYNKKQKMNEHQKKEFIDIKYQIIMTLLGALITGVSSNTAIIDLIKYLV